MAFREELDKEYVDFAVKLNDRQSLKANSDILEQFNLEISKVSDRPFSLDNLHTKCKFFGLWF